jgi:D-glycero-D-manno-heptose 1,7-bisphosphate phosphatase
MGKREMRAVFLDRDGVLNKAIVRSGTACSPRSREEFVLADGAAKAVASLHDEGFKVLVITNQPDIARGTLKQTDLDWMTEKILSDTRVDEVLVCPHDDHHACTCRKPRPGMLLEGARKWNIELTRSYVIGDSGKDMEAGKQAGCTCLLIDTEYNQGVPADGHVSCLLDAVKHILSKEGM